jgi:uncharacterized membrane protein YjfL (UPF0719 family)
MPNLFGVLPLDQVIGTIFYCALGVVLFVVAYALIEKLTPYSVRKEISEDQNIALGIIIGSVIIGLSIIIAAAIH